MAEHVVYHERAELALVCGPEMRHALERVCDDIARDAALAAPKRTGLGAASIHTEMHLGPAGWEGRISWTRDRYYMYMHEKGWLDVPARPFLRPAAERRRG